MKASLAPRRIIVYKDVNSRCVFTEQRLSNLNEVLSVKQIQSAKNLFHPISSNPTEEKPRSQQRYSSLIVKVNSQKRDVSIQPSLNVSVDTTKPETQQRQRRVIKCLKTDSQEEAAPKTEKKLRPVFRIKKRPDENNDYQLFLRTPSRNQALI